jgi:spermidine/putrescine transport system substrate-binding protein
MKILRFAVFLSLAAISLASCQRGSSSASGNASGSAQAPRVVNLGIWSNYLTPEAMAEFQRRTGIVIQVSNFSSNEELLAKIQAGGSNFDVILPSDYMIFAMTRLGILLPLDYTKLPHARGLDPRFLKKPFDRENQYSLPYDWGTTGIAVNRNLYAGAVHGWKDLFEKPDLAGKISLLDDPREVIGAALKAKGYSLNSHKPEELAQAKQLLLAARKRVKLFTSETLLTLTNSEASVSHAFVTDALQARRAMGGKVDYILPEEGGTLWLDNLAIPAHAPHPAEAHALIDFLLEPRTIVATVNQLFVSPANALALPLLPEAIRKDPLMFPSDKALVKFEMIEDLGEATQVWDRIWTEFKTSAQ